MRDTKRTYTEKLLEDFIRDYPLEFLGEHMSLHRQQPAIGGLRPDLVFRDQNGRFVVVEVQLNALDRNHLYRTLEYRDLLAEAEACDPPRIIVFCNKIYAHHSRLLTVHQIRSVVMTKAEFLELANRLRPDLHVTEESDPSDDDSHLTAERVLDALQEPCDKSRVEPDALVFWFPSWFPYPEARELASNDPKYVTVPSSTSAPAGYFNDHDAWVNTASREVRCLPRELIVKRSWLDKIDFEKLRAINMWLELLTHYAVSDGETIELVFGYRSFDDIYGYEDHIRNRVRKFEPLWRYYGREKGYDVDLLKNDLNLLAGITLYAGKYPMLQPSRPCSRIDVVMGPGHLTKRRRQAIEDAIRRRVPGYTPKTLEDFEASLEEDKDEWLSVSFVAVRSDELQCLRTLVRVIKSACATASSALIEAINKVGLRTPRALSEIPSSALMLSGR